MFRTNAHLITFTFTATQKEGSRRVFNSDRHASTQSLDPCSIFFILFCTIRAPVVIKYAYLNFKPYEGAGWVGGGGGEEGDEKGGGEV